MTHAFIGDFMKNGNPLNFRPDTELVEAFCDGQQRTMEHRSITPTS